MDETYEINLQELAMALLKKAWLIVLCAVLAAALTLVYTVEFVTPTYKASVTMYVNNNPDTSNKVSSGDLAVALQLVNTYVNIIQSDTVLEQVIAQTGLNVSAGAIRGMLSAEVMNETEMFQVSIVSPSAQMSADLANAIATVAPAEISKIIEGSSAKVVDNAKVPTSQYSPNVTRNTTLGGLIGAVLVIAVIVIITLLDKRIHSEADLEKVAKLPVLGVIPDFSETLKADSAYAHKSERQGK